VYDEFKQRFDEIGATYKADNELPQIPCESLLRQIFTNLIENAVTYRRKEKPLEINIGCELVPEGCIIKVADNGIGIPENTGQNI
jgi:signal transduction histidine kinase